MGRDFDWIRLWPIANVVSKIFLTAYRMMPPNLKTDNILLKIPNVTFFIFLFSAKRKNRLISYTFLFHLLRFFSCYFTSSFFWNSNGTSLILREKQTSGRLKILKTRGIQMWDRVSILHISQNLRTRLFMLELLPNIFDVTFEQQRSCLVRNKSKLKHKKNSR